MGMAERPTILSGKTYKLRTGCGNLYITVNRGGAGLSEMPNPLCGPILEVFATIGKTGGCTASFLQALTRMISLALRANVKVEKVIKMLEGIGCPQPFYGNPDLIQHQFLSCSDAVAKVLKLEEADGGGE